ncbi:MAG: hypothetical protein RL748_3756 [Pseudomonadota bacterium]|jgi:hypothetical protein
MKTTTTKNYMLEFSGWAQGRIATDPDPSNELRGVSGYTFALPGEANLDRIIYFQEKEGVIRRSHCPQVGVKVSGGYEFVTRGSGGDVSFVSKTPIEKGHPLYHAKVDLLDQPLFDSRNSMIIYNGFGIVNPFILSVEGKKLTLQRRFYAEPDNPQEDLSSYDISSLKQYTMSTVVMNSVEWILKTGVLDRTAFRNERLALLQADLKPLQLQLAQHPQDKQLKIEIAALNKRIAELKINDPDNRRTNQIGTQVLLSYPLNAKAAWVNDKKIQPPAAWPLNLWMGGWDADALGFAVHGYVQIILED